MPRGLPLERGDADEARRLHKMHATKRAERARSAHATPAQRKAASDACTAWLSLRETPATLSDFDAAYAKAEAWGVFDGAAAAPARARRRRPWRPVAAAAAARAWRPPVAAAPAAKRAKKVARCAQTRARLPRVRGACADAAAPAAGGRGSRARGARGAGRGRARESAAAQEGPSDDARRRTDGFLVGLKSDATEDELRTARRCGAVAQTRVLKDKRSGQPTGKGFVENSWRTVTRGQGPQARQGAAEGARWRRAVQIFASKYLCPERPAAPAPKAAGAFTPSRAARFAKAAAGPPAGPARRRRG